MATQADKLVSEIRALPDEEKLRLLDAILTDLDKPDPEIDRVWATEARKRWIAYKAGGLATVSYEELMAKYKEMHKHRMQTGRTSRPYQGESGEMMLTQCLCEL